MPTYVFRNTDTDEIVEHEMKMSELDQFKEDNPKHNDPCWIGLARSFKTN